MFKYSFRIKLGLFLFGIMIVLSVFGLNWYMVNSIREDAGEQVKHLAKAYTDAINNLDATNIQYVLEILLPSIHFPMVITSNDEIYAVKNVNIDEVIGSEQYSDKAWQIVRRMDKSFVPLIVTGNGKEISRIHYGDPEIVGKLQWVPYIEIGLAFLFVILGMLGFQFIRNSEKRSIWMGMAKETAHQLGTPVSSLMGWTKLLEEGEDSKDIIPAIYADLDHLSQISNRFQKIGSKSKFQKVSLLEISKKSADYMRLRIPSTADVKITVKGEKSIISGEETLLSWAMENLIKNAIDASLKSNGSISIDISSKPESAIIHITDSGSGIDRKNRKNIFNPGFSTKKRGWGLGLSLTRRIIEDNHHGQIRLISSKPGETIFKIELPL